MLQFSILTQLDSFILKCRKKAYQEIFYFYTEQLSKYIETNFGVFLPFNLII